MGSSTTGPSSGTPSLTAHLNEPSQSNPDDDYVPPTGAHLGRERTTLSAEAWDRIDRAVYHEHKRSRLCAKFLPNHRLDPHLTTVQADAVLSSINGSALNLSVAAPSSIAGVSTTNPAQLNIEDTNFLKILEPSVEFVLTQAQITYENSLGSGQNEQGESSPKPKTHHIHSTAVTLAKNATRLLCQLEEQLAFQGLNVMPGNQPGSGSPLLNGYAQLRGTPNDYGLLSAGPFGYANLLPPSQVIAVPQSTPTPPSTQAGY